MGLVYLFETTARDASANPVPVRLSTGEGYNHPSAPGYFEPAIAAAALSVAVQRAAFTASAFGAGDVQFGDVTAANTGALDAYEALGYGQAATLKVGDEAAPYGSFTTLVSARCRDVVPASAALAFVWQGRLRELDEPASPATFAGTNSGTTGLEGTANDIGGKRKPRAWGKLRNIEPVLLNASTRIYGWNFDKTGDRLPTHSLEAVRFRGSLWTFGTDYATAALLAASTPTNGTYNTCLAESLILMGGSVPLNGGPVTLDATIEADAADRTAPALLNRLLLDAGVAPADIIAGDIATLTAQAPYEAGIYLFGDDPYRALCDRLSASVAAVYIPDRLGRYRIRRIAAPSGVPVARFKRFDLLSAAASDEYDLLACEPVVGEPWVPAKEISVRYAPNFTPLRAADVAAAVSDDDRAFLTQAWRITAPQTLPDIAAQYGDAEVRRFDTLLSQEADALAMRAVFAALFGAKRRFWQASVSLPPSLAAALDIGDTVRLTQPRYGMAAGKDFVVHGIRTFDSTDTAELKLFG